MYRPPIIIDAKELEKGHVVPKTAGDADGGILAETNDGVLAEPGDAGEATQWNEAGKPVETAGGIGEATQSDKTVVPEGPGVVGGEATQLGTSMVPEVSTYVSAGEATQVDLGGWFPLLEWSTLRENKKYQYMAYTTQVGQPLLFFEPVIFINYQDECLSVKVQDTQELIL